MTTPRALLLLMALSFSTAAFAAKWTPLRGGKDGTRIEIDAASLVRLEEGKVRLWYRETYASPRRPESEAYSYTRLTTFGEFLCEKRLAGIVQQNYTALDGSEVKAEGFDAGEARPVAPDSSLEAVLAYACRPKAKPVVAAPPPPPPPPPEPEPVKKKGGKKGQEEPAPHPHWSYGGATGPENWGALSQEYALCRQGQRQSPIDIRKTIKADLPPIQFAYKSIPLSIVDNGHSIKVDTPDAGTITVDGQTYSLVQFHFHKPSEEKINGKTYDLVAHLVHQSKEGKLAVVAVLFEAGKKEHPLIRGLWSYLPLEQEKPVVRKDVVFDPTDLLPAKRSYYTFLGSLTTPPCTEGVLWLVLKTPVPVSKEQVAGFATIYKNNVRPIQPVNDRVIKEGR